MQEFSNTTFTETQPPPTCEDYEGYFNERNEISWKRKGFQPLVYFYIILGLCGFLSNLLIIAVFCKTKKLRNTRNFYIINLAVTDLLTSCISAPATMYATMYTFWPWDNYYSCKFFTCFQTLNMFTSCFTLVLISLDTFFLTYYPLDWPTKKYIHILLYIGVWLLALLITAPYIMAISLDYDYNLLSMNETEIYNLIEDCPRIIPLKICGESETSILDLNIYTFFVMTIQVLLPLSVLIFSYTQIGVVIRQRILIPKTVDTRRRNQQIKKTNRSILLLTSLILAFITIYLPMNVYQASVAILGLQYSQTTYIYFHLISVFSVIINPFLYGLINEHFKSAIMALLHQILNPVKSLGTKMCFKEVPTTSTRPSNSHITPFLSPKIDVIASVGRSKDTC